MVQLTDLPLYLLYSLAGTSSAGLAKAAIARAQARQWLPALVRAGGGGGALLASFGLLYVLLQDSDLSVMVPVAVASNIAMAALIARLVFRERLSRQKLVGMAVIAAGVIAIGLSG
ncbi:MAG: hypothetical protein EAZ99_15205 [Alphaproteobacteria bacterium]|nr:hypothetical protein [Alphaproteobacteria bacterium]TAD88082.1 MAG: hypothetical protein EAZ99_15205 [Alphaproteobacteria bacterium]